MKERIGAAQSSTSARRGASLGTVFGSWRSEIGVGTGILVLAVLWALLAPNFLSVTNIVLLLQQTSVLMIVAVGMTFVILTGDIDLSVGSTIGLTTVLLAAFTVKLGIGLIPGIFLVLLAGALIGLFTGILRVVWQIPSFIVTLGLLTALQGLAFTISDGVTISPIERGIAELWNGRILFVPTPIWIMAIIVAGAIWVLRSTRFGRHLYAVGGNPETARRYGVRVRTLRISVFVLVQVLAVVGGILYSAQLNAGNATVGQQSELNVIAGVVVGGVALFGGVGRPIGTVLGIFFIAVLANGLTLLGVSPYVFLIAQGLVVIAAVWYSALQRKGRSYT
ncbi:ABC transporter permease [Brevibacterium oceani]|uniref:ABC transporter permease n=1 Tax=Brevibacterium oceani TaxID=358099 RepID=UPI001B33C9E9|nr:ABC transporter permease [Brevibacterium oceani]